MWCCSEYSSLMRTETFLGVNLVPAEEVKPDSRFSLDGSQSNMPDVCRLPEENFHSARF
jgi:hypothetical protein